MNHNKIYLPLDNLIKTYKTDNNLIKHLLYGLRWSVNTFLFADDYLSVLELKECKSHYVNFFSDNKNYNSYVQTHVFIFVVFSFSAIEDIFKLIHLYLEKKDGYKKIIKQKKQKKQKEHLTLSEIISAIIEFSKYNSKGYGSILETIYSLQKLRNKVHSLGLDRDKYIQEPNVKCLVTEIDYEKVGNCFKDTVSFSLNLFEYIVWLNLELNKIGLFSELDDQDIKK